MRVDGIEVPPGARVLVSNAFNRRRNGVCTVATATKESTMKLQIFQAPNGEWYWHLRSRNGRIMADGGEGYKTFGGVCRAVHKVFPFDYQRTRDAIAAARKAHVFPLR